MGAPTGTKESSYEAPRGALRLLLMEYPNEVAHMEHGSSLGIPRGDFYVISFIRVFGFFGVLCTVYRIVAACPYA